MYETTHVVLNDLDLRSSELFRSEGRYCEVRDGHEMIVDGAYLDTLLSLEIGS